MHRNICDVHRKQTSLGPEGTGSIQQHVIPFLRDPNNVLDTNEVIFLHDKAPCVKTNATQHLLEDEGVRFWGNTI
ncbi:unnamed protein product [Rotaria sp. Silwood2]|nr:unnamed protein product [Rotaria sp. Silwood2]CAF2750828.1 unnamed protein product [Rotaria sp. Silwood2]CAF3041228.1 unnamed protein product [Rotaria sp. Silwood2]CAF4144145.1 unnamed protein product [Rotaria sp. Silwood2]CAF4152958.1 unnamed protein product [Rotaria sp. Silwood2]